MTLDERSADPDPIRQFGRWLEAARAAGIENADAMTLATATPEGGPSARLVLCRGADDRGFVFYTNSESRKARELEVNARAALVFYWASLGRQVRVEGVVEALPRAEAELYFATRPRGSQLGAWASPQSAPIASRAALEHRLAEVEERFAGGDVPLPPFWGGFRVTAETVELWEHRESRLHDRLRYTRSSGGWTIQRLAP